MNEGEKRRSLNEEFFTPIFSDAKKRLFSFFSFSLVNKSVQCLTEVGISHTIMKLKVFEKYQMKTIESSFMDSKNSSFRQEFMVCVFQDRSFSILEIECSCEDSPRCEHIVSSILSYVFKNENHIQIPHFPIKKEDKGTNTDISDFSIFQDLTYNDYFSEKKGNLKNQFFEDVEDKNIGILYSDKIVEIDISDNEPSFLFFGKISSKKEKKHSREKQKIEIKVEEQQQQQEKSLDNFEELSSDMICGDSDSLGFTTRNSLNFLCNFEIDLPMKRKGDPPNDNFRIKKKRKIKQQHM